MIFRNLFVEDPEHLARPLMTLGCFVPGLSARSIAIDGELHERVRDFLRAEVLVRPADVGMTGGNDAAGIVQRTLIANLNPPLEDQWDVAPQPAIVLMVGTVDLIAMASTVGPFADFVLNDERFAAAAFEHPKLPLVPAAEIEELVRSQIAPVRDAIGALRDLGLTNVYLHSLMPPSLDDAQYFRVRGVVCSAKLRYKLTLLINNHLRDIARQTGARYVDLWPSITIGNVRDPRFAFDVDHGNRDAAALTLRALVEDAVVRRSRPLDHEARYDLPF